MVEIIVPAVGESITSGILAVWLKKDGDFVQAGEEVFELETDKATMAIPAPADGVLKISVQPGSEIEIGSVVGTLDESAQPSDSPKATQTTEAKTPPSSSVPVQSSPPASTQAPSTQDNVATKTTEPNFDLSDLTPGVRKMVAEAGINPGLIRGTGPQGRILKEDVQAYLAGSKGGSAQPVGGATTGTHSLGGSQTVSAPQMAVKGSSQERTQRRIPMTPIRKKIAERLVASKQGAAHLTTFNEVDMSAVMSLRKTYKDVFEKKHGVRLGFMSFYIKAAQKALEAFPEVNAYIDGTDILYNDFIDIGVAMSTDRGLITPVIRNVENMGFADIERAIVEYGEKAKAKRILPGDLMGGTFTVSNGGVFGSMLSTPIPNPPQTAVMGMHSIQDRPVVRDGQIVIRPMMYLALTYDHRMIDGKEAISFLMLIKELIEDPARIALDV
jgi:2-oxoglutarate dehydrogenase E2 component (dihydrolipoamide succinyltransferase)